MLVGAAGFYVIFLLAGLPWKVIVGSSPARRPILWSMLHDYQRKRILTLLDPTTDPLGPAITSSSRPSPSAPAASFRGRLNGTQTHRIHPGTHTDFIFAVYSGRMGTASATASCSSCYTLLIGRGLMIALGWHQPVFRLLAGAITLVLHLRLHQHGHGQRHPAGGRRPAPS